MFVASDKLVCLQCGSYLEVSSRDCLLVRDERVWLQCEIIFRDGYIAETISSLAIKRVDLLFGSWLTNPLKRTKTKGRKFLKSSFQVRAGPVKRTETRQGW